MRQETVYEVMDTVLRPWPVGFTVIDCDRLILSATNLPRAYCKPHLRRSPKGQSEDRRNLQWEFLFRQPKGFPNVCQTLEYPYKPRMRRRFCLRTILREASESP